MADLPDEINGLPKRKYLFQLDCEHMDWCDAVLLLFDGRVPDEGACFELGYCYAKGKRCIGYKTDARSFIDGFDNVMLHGVPEVVLRNEQELQEFFYRRDGVPIWPCKWSAPPGNSGSHFNNPTILATLVL